MYIMKKFLFISCQKICTRLIVFLKSTCLILPFFAEHSGPKQSLPKTKKKTKQTKKTKRPMGHIAHLRKQFKSINTYDYIITLIKRRKKNID